MTEKKKKHLLRQQRLLYICRKLNHIIMKKLVTIILFIAMAANANSQAPSFLWAKGAGGTGIVYGANSVMDASGNTYVTGYYNSSATFRASNGSVGSDSQRDYDGFVAKYTSSGAIDWITSFGAEGDDRGLAITLSPNGYYVYITGYFTSNYLILGVSTLINSGGKDFFVGQFVANTGGASGVSARGQYDEEGSSISADAAGNLYVTGYFNSSNFTLGTTTLVNTDTSHSSDIFIVKYNSSLVVQWAKSAGGTGIDKAYGISTDASSNVYITGAYESASVSFDTTTLVNNGISDVFVAKYNATGNLQWAKNYGGTLADYGTGIAVSASGNSYITGYFTSDSISFSSSVLNNANPGTEDIFVAKLDGSGNPVWAKSAGGVLSDKGAGIALDTAGNAYVTGSFSSTSITFNSTNLINANAGALDVFAVKYNTAGTIVWAKSGGGNMDDKGTGITVDKNSNAIVTGTYKSPTITFGSNTITNPGGTALFVAKFSTSIGSASTNKSAVSTHNDEAVKIVVDPNGNSYVTGYFNSSIISFDSITLTNMGSRDIFLVKYGPSGNVIWAKSAGGSSYETVNSVSLDSIGNIYLTGTASSNPATFGNITINGGHGFFAKYDSNGNILMAQEVGGYCDGIMVDRTGNIYITGYYSGGIFSGAFSLQVVSGINSPDMFIAKYNPSGNLVWTRGSIGDCEDIGQSIDVDPSGNVYVIGTSASSTIDFGGGVSYALGINNCINYGDFIVKYNSAGTPQWVKIATSNVSDYKLDLCVDNIGNSYFMADSVFKYDTSGNLLLVKQLPTTTYEGGKIKADNYGNFYVGGQFNNASTNITFDSITLVSSGNRDMYIVEYNSVGDAMWAKLFGGSSSGMQNYDVPTSITIDANNKVYVAGYAQSLNCSYDTINIANTGGYDIFTSKIDNYHGIATSVSSSNNANGVLRIYPNPCTNQLTITSTNQEIKSIKFLDITGRVVLTPPLNGRGGAGGEVINLSSLSNGIYFAEIQTEKITVVKKVVKQ